MNRICIVSVLAACALASAREGIRILVASQSGAPVRIARTSTMRGSLLRDAELRNDGIRDVIAYRLGWAYVREDDEMKFHAGALTHVELGRGIFRTVQGEDVSFDVRAHDVIFFVAEVVFADGDIWKVDKAEIKRDAVSRMTDHHVQK